MFPADGTVLEYANVPKDAEAIGGLVDQVGPARPSPSTFFFIFCRAVPFVHARVHAQALWQHERSGAPRKRRR